jgi:hypothetical protein
MPGSPKSSAPICTTSRVVPGPLGIVRSTLPA